MKITLSNDGATQLATPLTIVVGQPQAPSSKASGAHSPNFVIGTPATLPTTAFAKAMSGVTAHAYINTIAIADIGEAEFWHLSDEIKAFADHEGFPAHSRTVDVRKNRSSRFVRCRWGKGSS
jgi:hypothetical protein